MTFAELSQAIWATLEPQLQDVVREAVDRMPPFQRMQVARQYEILRRVGPGLERALFDVVMERVARHPALAAAVNPTEAPP